MIHRFFINLIYFSNMLYEINDFEILYIQNIDLLI
jgi:hypothetical protein